MREAAGTIPAHLSRSFLLGMLSRPCRKRLVANASGSSSSPAREGRRDNTPNSASNLSANSPDRRIAGSQRFSAVLASTDHYLRNCGPCKAATDISYVLLDTRKSFGPVVARKESCIRPCSSGRAPQAFRNKPNYAAWPFTPLLQFAHIDVFIGRRQNATQGPRLKNT